MCKKSRYEKIHSDRGLTFKTEEGERVAVKINKEGVISLKSNLSPNTNSKLGFFEITGLTARKAASKKKSFWRGLWNKVKSVAGDLLDAVTIPVFGYSCRPNISVDIKNRGMTFGISCKETIN